MVFLVSNVHNVSTLLDLVIIILAIVISYQSGRIYSYIRKDSYKYFSLAFLLIGFGYLFKILTNFTIVYRAIFTDYNILYVVFREYSFMQAVHFLSFLFYKSLVLFGLLVLFLVVRKVKSRGEIFLLFYAGFVAVLFSMYVDSIFHLTLGLCSLLLSIYYYRHYKETHAHGSLIVVYAFLLMMVGSFICVFSFEYPFDCLVEEIFFALGFILLSLNHFHTRHAKKKNTT